MRLRNIKGSTELIADSEYVIQDILQQKGNWSDFFRNKNPLHIEIGMGKGLFLTQMALKNPDINYIGIEKYTSVLVRALDKRKKYPEIENLFFLCIDAEEIINVFAPHEVNQIFLNFSDPWPKDRHSKRRLTSRQFLDRYKQILIPEGYVEFKTDNRKLFDFSIEEAKADNWTIHQLTFDLHADSELSAGNIMTEYEEKFSALGQPICKFKISQHV